MKTSIATLALLCPVALFPAQLHAASEGPALSCSTSAAVFNQEDESAPPKPIEPPQEAEPDC